MCRPKPGPRCPSCQHRALASITGRLERLLAQIDDLPAGHKRAKLEGQARDLARKVACRRADLYATAAFQREHSAELDDLLRADPRSKRAATLADQLLEGRIMDCYRRQQAAAMPTPPTNETAQVHYRELGDARFDMAHAKVRMDMARGNTTEWQHWQAAHHDAAQRAALAAARMQATEADGTTGWASLSPDEQARRRNTAADDPTLATPVAPRRWRDVVDEVQDVDDGHTPTRERLDDTGYAPFGDPAPRTRPVAADTGESISSDQQRRDAAWTQQERRRRKRRTASRVNYRQLRAGARRIESSVQRTDSAIDEATPSPRTEGGLYDLTLLSYFIEKVGAR